MKNRKILILILIFSFTIFGCSSGDDNAKIEDMLKGEYNGKTVEITGITHYYNYDETMNLTTIQIYPNPKDESILVVVYLEGEMETTPAEGDLVNIVGTSNGEIIFPIPDTRVLGIIAQSIDVQ